MVRVTATAFQKQFGKWAERAIKEPVAIEKHGRETHYLVSAERYAFMRSLERRSFGAEGISDELLELIERAEYGK
ncbi:MAG: type II toxin-antitoxin system Phd/YefM family antitoxin [Rhodospirillaceae bacterium]|nr:type II toxin-antitoxin system Phd/YefM family antitoxin [Rhodospirillaceae bacterium]